MKLHRYISLIIGVGFFTTGIFFCLVDATATDNQDITSVSLQTLASSAGGASPASAYNPGRKEFMVIFTAADGSCTSNQELRGYLINATTGQKTGTTINLTSSIQPCGTRIIKNPRIVFNSVQNDYFIVFNMASGLGSSLMYMTVNASTYQVTKAPTEIQSDEIADPFRSWFAALDANRNIYMVGYHTENAQQESTLTVNYISGSTKVVNAYTTTMGPGNFVAENKGAFNTQILSYGTQVLLASSIKFTAGSEIYGVFLNSQTGAYIGSTFRISPTGASDKNYAKPSAVYNPSLNEVFLTYEEVRATTSTAALNHKILGQRIHGTTGNILSPINAALTELPGTLTEDSKAPVVQYSVLSKEYLIHFYGVRYTASTDLYNNYIQRINSETIVPIGNPSTLVASSTGSQLSQNNSLKLLALAFNGANNQFLLSWASHTTNNIFAQVWRYDNNQPTSPVISSSAQNENLPIGSAFATLSSSDPDPEDSSPAYTLVTGTGSVDNSFFSIVGNELRVAKNLNFEQAATRSVRVRVTDSHGGYAESVFTLTINNINEKPFNIALSGPLTVIENSTTFSGSISVQDEDVGDSHVLSLVAGDSSANNSHFTIDGPNKTLKLVAAPDFEATPKLFVRIRATDSGGLMVEKGFVITITDINEAPTDLVLSSNLFNENDVVGFSTVSAVDQDKTTNYTYTLFPGTGDNDNNSFNLTTNKLYPREVLNYEVKSSYTIRIKASDGVFEISKAFTIGVIDKNDAPHAITLSADTIMDGEKVGFTIGYFLTEDEDATDIHTLSLLTGQDKFLIDNQNNLVTRTVFVYDYNNPQNNLIPIKVQTKDQAGAVFSKDFTITVTEFEDDVPPMILNIGNNPDYSLIGEQSITFSIDATDNEELDMAYFYYRSIRSADDFIQLPSITIERTNATFFSVSATVSSSMMDSLGLEYYFEVVDGAGNPAYSDTAYLYQSYDSKDFSAVNGSFKGDLKSYRIITNPYDLGSTKISKVFADYGSSGKNTWRLYSFEDDENTELGNSNGLLEQGLGYWFNKMPKTDQAITLDNPKVNTNNRENLFKMSLEKGWNLIGNPYPFELSWNEVMMENGLNTNDIKLFTYNGNYSQSTTLSEFEGGFVFVESPVPLSIPVVKGANSAGRLASADLDDHEWLISLSLNNGSHLGNLASFGMHQDASESYDRHDIPTLPGFIDGASLNFRHPEHFVGSFVRDIAPLSGNYAWEFDVIPSADHRQTSFSWHGVSSVSAGKRLILYDIMNDKVVDMANDNNYTLLSDKPASFKILYGDSQFIANSMDNILIEALSPYPNPFNNHLTIPLKLPPSSSPYEYDLVLFNMLGEPLSISRKEGIAGGLTEVVWEEDLQWIAPGMYLYSITLRNGQVSKKFHGRILKN